MYVGSEVVDKAPFQLVGMLIIKLTKFKKKCLLHFFLSMSDVNGLYVQASYM